MKTLHAVINGKSKKMTKNRIDLITIIAISLKNKLKFGLVFISLDLSART